MSSASPPERSNVTRLVHNGRGIVAHDVDGERVAGWPEVAYEAIRAVNHVTGGVAVPAPVLYDVVGELKGVGHLLPQALDQLGQGLRASLDEYTVTDESGREPAETVEQAVRALNEAAERARELGALLEQVQSLVAEQGYDERAD